MTRLLSIVAVLGLIYGGSRILAQEQHQATDSGSLAALTTEIHQLRLAVEESTRAQTQIQATAAYLGVQKDRMIQLAARLDSAHKDVDAASEPIRKWTAAIADGERFLGSGNVSAEARRTVDLQIEEAKHELEGARTREQGLKSRELELQQVLQAEDARWNELVSRMEQAIKR